MTSRLNVNSGLLSRHLNSLGFIVKVSERCNLACKYCYFFFKEDESYKDNPAIMPIDVARKHAEFIADIGVQYGVKSVKVGLHGGEPLMLSKKKIADLCEVYQTFSGAVEVKFSLQTNGALMDSDWAKLLTKYNIGVGVSLDGKADVNDRYRTDKLGRGSHADCIAGYKLLRDYNVSIGKPKPGLLCVVNPDADAEETFNHFVDDLGANQMNFLLPYSTHDENVSEETVALIGDYMVTVFNSWVERKQKELDSGIPAPKVRFIQETIAGMINDKISDIYAESFNDYRNLFTISSNGDISPEDSLKGSVEEYSNTGLNVYRDSMDEVLTSNFWSDLTSASQNKPAACEGCRWWKVCRGGTPSNRYSIERKFDNASIYCKSLKKYYSAVFEFLSQSGYDSGEMNNRLAIRSVELVE